MHKPKGEKRKAHTGSTHLQESSQTSTPYYKDKDGFVKLMKILRNPNSNTFCVPAALAALTGLHVDSCVDLIRQGIRGDTPISGVYYPFVLKIFGKLGYHYQERTGIDRTMALPQKLNVEFCKLLLCFDGHVGVLDYGTYFDNAHPNGTTLGSMWFSKNRKSF